MSDSYDQVLSASPKPLYAGPNDNWAKFRIWGSQAYLLSRRLVLALLTRWDDLAEVQDARVLTVCNELRIPLWYPDPCLVEHVPAVTAFGTPIATAPDFDADCVIEREPGFQPPEAVPGWLTEAEGELLFQAASGRRVLELATHAGRATVCLAQSAESVISVGEDYAEAAEWVRRYGLGDRVEFTRTLPNTQFDLILIDGEHDTASVGRDIVAAVARLASSGRLAFHDYPDPGWPEVRRTVDAQARRFGWRRIAQEGYLALFQA